MMEFTKYAKIKDNYCICYFGLCDEYVCQLNLLRPLLELHFPGLNIFIGCRDQSAKILSGTTNVLLQSELRSRHQEFAQIKEIKFNGSSHPIEDLMQECGITEYRVPVVEQVEHTSRCVIVTKTNHPSKNLKAHQIARLKKMAKEDGYDVVLDDDIAHAGRVMGAESFQLFEAAGRGLKTFLVPTGLGTRLYRNMFSNGVVLHN